MPLHSRRRGGEETAMVYLYVTTTSGLGSIKCINTGRTYYSRHSTTKWKVIFGPFIQRGRKAHPDLRERELPYMTSTRFNHPCISLLVLQLPSLKTSYMESPEGERGKRRDGQIPLLTKSSLRPARLANICSVRANKTYTPLTP